eukprot:12588328-Alexandrium_andersonii.AAC.1
MGNCGDLEKPCRTRFPAVFGRFLRCSTSRKLLENAANCSKVLQTACSAVVRLALHVRRWLTSAKSFTLTSCAHI